MKYCDKCKKSFPDNQVFCSECGNKLNDSATHSNGMSTNNTSFGNTSGTSNSSINVWLPVILAAVGALIGWFLSGLLGFVLGGAGLSIVIQRKKQGQHEQVPFVLTWILAIIDTIFWIIAMTA